MANYILLFAAFGLFGLAIISTKYERRQTGIEQEFHGIQQMQRDAGSDGAGQGGAPTTPDQRPLIITLRPLMIVVGIITLVAFLAVLWQNKHPPSPTE
ncbi:MAG: hypothetical protein OES79_11110 [Planctomycetota bacterium]|nr:hypothetical protein [Planctomycetota bacterium]